MSIKPQIKKKKGFRDYVKIVVHMPLPCLKSASRGFFQSFAGLREREIVVHKRIKQKNQYKYKKQNKKTTNKQTNQNKTKIYKRMNEEYITHAQ